MKKVNKKVIRRIIISLSSITLVAALIVFVVMLVDRKVEAITFFPNVESYESDQDTISSGTRTNNYISMTEVNQSSTVASGKVITISTPTEFNLFASKCETTPVFLTYSYELMGDIDFSGSGIQHVKLIGYSTPFSGHFNGNGYEIKNISLLDITQSSNTDYQFSTTASKPVQYYALFSKNSGTIENLGLVSPEITVSYMPSGNGLAYVAPLVGLNTGSISHCYTKETRSETINSSGIYTVGGFYVSGFASVNNGTIEDVYTARTILSTSNSIGVIAQAEILNEGNQPVHSFFYDSTINSYQGSDGGECTILFNSVYVSQDIHKVVHYGTYCNSTAVLTSEVVENDSQSTSLSVGSWYNLSKYSASAQEEFKDSKGEWIYGTPIARGISHESNMTFKIQNEREFSYMFELFELNKNFATSKATFEIEADLDMSCILAPSYYTSDIGATIVGKKNGQAEAAITIYNAPITKYYAKTLGINCFGVFPWLTGSVSYVNAIIGTSSTPFAFNFNRNQDINKLAIGAISGYVDGGTIDHCNVYINMSFDNSIGKYSFGGITGMIGSTSTSTGVLSNSTVTGTITQTNNSVGVMTETIDYLDGMSLGGAVGYLEYTSGSVDTVLADMTITAAGITNKAFHIGGVVGAGYAKKLNQLHFKGSLNLTNPNYSSLYVAGVVGRLLGVTEQADYLTNFGTINLTQKSGVETYVSGVLNSDLQTPYSSQSSEYLTVSSRPLVEKGSYYFNASSLTNKADINISNISSNLNYSEVLNVKTSNRFISNLSGLYNLKTSNDISISMNLMTEFAPVLNNIGGNSSYLVDVSTMYNFKNINITMSSSVNNNVTYAGVARGEYINYTNVHNLGNITVTINNQYGNGSQSMIVSGITKEISAGCHAYNVYNKGNIAITYTAKVTANIYASGICYANKNGFDSQEIKKFDPSSDKYESSAIGSINNCINNGNVTVTNPNYSSLVFNGKVEVKSANGSVTTENHYYATTAPSANLVGNINATGIVNYNYSVITNTFNIADMFAANYINATKKNEINVSGLVTFNIGEYAVIENSANDGVIKGINLSFYMVFDNGQTSVNQTTAQYAFVNASGIICHNDENEDGTPYSNGGTNSKQIIAFTINYGSIYSYNVARNSTTSSATQFRTISAGILGMGLLDLVNVVNYGNIYGSEVSGGIVGVMFFDSFNTEVTSANQVTLANTINYGNVLVIDKGELNYRDSSYVNQTYDSFRALNNNSTVFYVSLPVYSQDYFNGSIFGIINFSGSSNAGYVIIRYLISFNEDVSLVGAEAQTPTVTVDLSTFYSAYILFDGSYTLDTYIGKNVVYAPLSTGSTRINGTTYYGVFNERFQFRQAMNGNEAYLDIAHYPTDSFITDYFEFVGATYVNESLLNTIGWGAIAYNAAAESFATSLSGVAKFISYLAENNQSQYNTLITNALATETWLSKCNETDILDVISELIKNEQEAELLEVIRYVFSNSSSNSYPLINTTIRKSILQLLTETDNNISYSSLLDTIINYNGGYSSILANSVLEDDDAGEYLKTYLSSLSQERIKSILRSYCEYLDSASNNGYFTFANTSQRRFDILRAIFDGVDETTFYTRLSNILGITSAVSSYSLSNELAMYEGLSNLPEASLPSLYKAIILNNSYANLRTYIDTMGSEIDYYINLMDKGYLKTSLTDIANDVSATSSSNATSVIDERIELWNQVRNTEVFKQYLSTKVTNDYTAKATEVNNTYQTTTYPYPVATSAQGDLSFTYTFDITPATYFLGPYLDTARNQFDFSKMTNTYAPTCGDSNETKRSVIDVTTKAEADYLFTNGYTNYYQLFYYEYSDSSSNNQLCSVRRYINGNIENKYAFTWFKTSNTTDFTGGFLRGEYTDVNDSWVQGESWVDVPIMVEDINGVTFDANGGGISKFTSTTAGSTGENGYANNLSRTGTWVITDINQKQHTVRGTLTQWADFIIAHEVRHYISYPTTALHSTLCTGLRKYRSGNRWFTWNSTDHGVLSSQYIDYNVEQLLALDGYLTSYGDGDNQSADERTIINDLFNTYFVNDSNFTNVIASSLLERNAQYDDDSYYYVGTPVFNDTNKVYYRITAARATSYNQNTKYYSMSGRDYIEADASKVNSTNYASYYTLTATRVNDYYNYDDCYQMKEVDGYDRTKIKDFMITNIYTTTEVASKAPFEYLYISQSLSQGNLITVKQYLMNLVTSLTKDKFIGYCVDNQQVFAKLLLELMKIDTLDASIPSSYFPKIVGDSDTSDVTIPNMSYYENLTVVDDAATIDGTTYDYGYTFEIFRIDVSTADTKILLYLKSSSATNFYYYRSTASNWEAATQINGSTVYELELTGCTFVYFGVLGDDAGKIALYHVKTIQANGTRNISHTWLNTGTQQTGVDGLPGYIIYTLPTATDIDAIIVNDLSNNEVSYDSYTYSVSATITSHNNSSNNYNCFRYHRFIIDNDGSTSTREGTTIAQSDSTINYNGTFAYTTSIDDYLGRSVGLISSQSANGTYVYFTETRGNKTYRVRFYSIVLSITVNYETNHERDLITQSTIQDTALNGVTLTDEKYCTHILKNTDGYSSRFNELLIDSTYNLMPINYAEEAFIDSLVSNTYYVNNGISYDAATGEYDSSLTYYTYDGETYQIASASSATYYASMTSNKYFIKSGDEYVYATGAYNSNTTYYRLAEHEESTLAVANLVDLVGLNEVHQDNDYCVIELLEKLLTATNEAFISFINNTIAGSENAVADYTVIINYLASNVGYYMLADAIKKLNESGTLSTETKNILASAYLVTDYKTILKNNTSINDSYLKHYIDAGMDSTYRYIYDNTYDRTKFEAFCREIGYSLSTTGFGIYALASSYGIQDGTFIPDNLVLSSMNPHYNSSYQITASTNPFWRSGSNSDEDSVSDTTSINYAFYEEMRQLKKSISTAIIELDLTDGVNVYSSNTNQTTKSGVDGKITYYITSDELSSITTSLQISTLVIANKAKLYLVNGSSESLYNKDSNNTITVTKNGNVLTTTYKFKVVAEDTSVYTVYDIVFIILGSSDTFTLEYSDDHTTSKNYPYTGGTVNLSFTSNSLNENIDLTPYITISNDTNSYNYLNNKAVFKQYFSYYTYGNYQVTNSQGDAEIKLEVFQALPAGTYTIKVKIGSNEASVTMVKAASTACQITKFEFDNASVTKSSNTYSSKVLFGRTFSKESLTVEEGTKGSVMPLYLSAFEISPNATYSATPTYVIDQTTGLVTYTITYKVTAENGAYAYYYHNITETDPFAQNDTFATVYENGDSYDTNTLYTTTNHNTTTHDLSADASININFTRDLGQPNYRVYYTLTNFYITANNFTFSDVTTGTGNGHAALTDAYAGFTVHFTSNCDVGSYSFEYNYHSEASWGDTTLERNYKFPVVNIVKEASEDSWINGLSLLDSYLSEGTNATKISYEIALVPSDPAEGENAENYGYASNEIYYENFKNTHGITINTQGDLNYSSVEHGDMKVSNKNYFILGNVSDASLASYQPTIKINTYAEIYQYLTEVKADGSYGASQVNNDTALLRTNGTEAKYLYIPYFIDANGNNLEDEGEEYVILLVKLEVVWNDNTSSYEKNLTSVYFADEGIYDDDGVKRTAIHTFTDLTLQEIHSTGKNSFTADGKKYVVSSSAGEESNASLNMNYIGSPRDEHFWYVSYAVFSESYLKNSNDVTHVDFFHIAIVDLTNNVYFTIKVNVPDSFNLNAIYLNINYITYDEMNQPSTTSVAVYAIRSAQGSLVFETQYDLAMLPSGYYTFTLELPGGYLVTYKASGNNKQGTQTDPHPGHTGTYLPPSSVVPIQIDLEFTVAEDNSEQTGTDNWGIGTSSTTTVTATYTK